MPNSWFVGIGITVSPWFGNKTRTFRLTTGFGYTEYDGEPSIQDPCGLCRGHEYFVTILGKTFKLVNRVFGTYRARKAV